MSAMEEVADLVREHLGVRAKRVVPLSGGDINRAFRVELSDGADVFVKTNDAAPDELFHREAEGLRWLEEAAAIRVPRVLAVARKPTALILEYVKASAKDAGDPEVFGRQLAALHASGAVRFGHLPDNFIGTLRQDNRSCAAWCDFWIERRLHPQFELALGTGRAPKSWARDLEPVYREIRARVVEPGYPERLHGDLWAGNVLTEQGTGHPVLIDPAAYAGHGEVDLAMMQLFGGFDERVFAAYWETRGGGDGWAERIPIYQLYPLLVHANLFGASYVSAVSAVMNRLAGRRGAT